MKLNLIRNVPFFAAAATAAFVTTAYAAPADDLLARNARLQSRIEQDLAASRIDPLRAAQVQQRASEVYRMQAQEFGQTNDERREELRQAQRDLAGAITWAEKHPAKAKATEIDRTRMQVATTRNAEQQRLIARGYAQQRLSADQVEALQKSQALIAAAQYNAAAEGKITQDEARAIQGAQNLQDYTIKKDPSVAELLANPAEGEEIQPSTARTQ